jgi:hypothetical protein
MLHDGAPLTDATIPPANFTSKAKQARTKNQASVLLKPPGLKGCKLEGFLPTNQRFRAPGFWKDFRKLVLRRKSNHQTQTKVYATRGSLFACTLGRLLRLGLSGIGALAEPLHEPC